MLTVYYNGVVYFPITQCVPACMFVCVCMSAGVWTTLAQRRNLYQSLIRRWHQVQLSLIVRYIFRQVKKYFTTSDKIHTHTHTHTYRQSPSRQVDNSGSVGTLSKMIKCYKDQILIRYRLAGFCLLTWFYLWNVSFHFSNHSLVTCLEWDQQQSHTTFKDWNISTETYLLFAFLTLMDMSMW